MKPTYTFTTEVWLYPGVGGWHFVSLPQNLSAEIKEFYKNFSHGWGSIKVEAEIGKTIWKTSMFPDKKRNTYLLPLKADIRRKEYIKSGQNINVGISIITI